MKKLSVLMSVILCGVILIFSYATWKEKIANAGRPAETAIASAPKEDTKEEMAAVSEETPEIDLKNLTAGMDPQVQKLFYNKKEQDETVQMLIVGSEAMDAGQPGYGELLAAELETVYGGFIETELLSFDGTSEEFLMSGPQLSGGYDVVLLEPFTLNNNGRVEIEMEQLHIQNIFGEVLSDESNAVLVLHPPQPIYGAQFYRTQEMALEDFARIQGYVYIDHWQEWPATDDLALKEYLTEDSNPNNTGAETWANALIAYFTGS